MGLDLVLYTAEKYGDEGEELAYGRKTWVIENFFERRCKMVAPNLYIFSITKEAWNEFINNLTPYLDNKSFRTFIETYDEFDEGSSDEIEELIESFLDKALEADGHYQLGPVWEAHAVLDWYEADAKVQDCFIKGEPVWILASF